MTVKNITLLSMEEYKKYRPIVPEIDFCWWLRSPGIGQRNAVSVIYGGSIYKNGFNVDRYATTVRPALEFNLDTSDNLFWYKPEKLIGTKIDYGKYQWTILNAEFGELYVLCDVFIANRCFDPKSNDWDKSELKQWLETEGLKLIAGEGDSADDC